MYLLITIGLNDYRYPSVVSEKKSTLEDHIKKKGYYWSKKWQRYINDKSGKRTEAIDYIIREIENLKEKNF